MARKGKQAETAAQPDANAEQPLTEKEKDDLGPVLTLINKRQRAARKKLNRINELLAKKDELHADQAETVKAKPGVLAILEELGKLVPLLKDAAADEVQAGIAKADAKVKAKAERRAEREAKEAADATAEASTADKDDAKAAEAQQEATTSGASETAAAAEPPPSDRVDRLLSLLYFSQLFENPTDYLQRMERDSCLSYDSYDENTQEQPLTPEDLDAISKFGMLLVKRHAGKTISHSEALEECKKLAQTYLSEPDSRLPDDVASPSTTTVEQLALKLGRVMATEYFTIRPVPQEPAIGGGSSEGDFRGLAVSQAEAVLEPPQAPSLPAVQPMGAISMGLAPHSSQVLGDAGSQQLPDQLGVGDAMLSGHPQQLPSFYPSGAGGMYTGGQTFHPQGTSAAFAAMAPGAGFAAAPHMPAISFMSESKLDSVEGNGEQQAAAPAQQPQQHAPEAAAPVPQQPPAPQQPAQQTQQQPAQQQQQALMNGGNSTGVQDQEVPGPPRGGRGRGPRRGGRGAPFEGRGNGGRFQNDGQGRGGYQGRGGEGRGGYRGDGQGGRGGGYQGGRGEGRGYRGGRGVRGAAAGGNPQQQQQAPQQ